MEPRLQRIGVLDPNRDFAGGLQKPLLRRGYLTDVMKDEAATEEYCATLQPAAVILDLSNGGDETPRLVERIRKSGFTAPIIVLGDATEDSTHVETLRVGADDSLPKPRSAEELLERLDFILERYGLDNDPGSPSDASRLDHALTPTERRIVEALLAAAPEPLSREDIMWEVKRQRISPEDRTLDVYISNIRRKIRLINAGIHIETVRGVGFRYAGHAAKDLGPGSGAKSNT